MWGRAKTTLFAVCLLAIGSCGPSGGGRGGHGAFGMHHLAAPLMHRAMRTGLRSARPRGVRRACAEDVAKLCPNMDRRREQRECLEGKRSLLSADCREAIDSHHGHARDRSDNNNR